MMKRMLSGIKPTGRVTLGNYIGAIKPFVQFQNEYEMIIFVANLHSMTIYQEPKDLRKNINIAEMIKSIHNMDDQTKKMISETIQVLFKCIQNEIKRGN